MKFVCFFVCIFLVACQSSQSIDTAFPEWWTSPPADSDQWLYGLGQGSTMELANQQALANIAGKLRTTISTSLYRRTQETNVGVDDHLDRHISSEIEEIPLSNFEILKTKTLSQSVLTIIRINKDSLAQDWLRQYKSISDDIEKIISSDKGNKFQWWLYAQPFLSKSIYGDKLAELYSILMEKDQPNRLHQKLKQNLQDNKPEASIEGDQPDINKALSEALILQGIKVNDCHKCDLLVTYGTTFISEKLFGENIVRMNFSGYLEDDDGTFSSGNWSVMTSSIQGGKAGKDAARFIAIEKIKDEGLWKAFSMNISN